MTKFGGRILSLGTLPPAGGEPRRRYLEYHGAQSFNRSIALFKDSHGAIEDAFLKGTIDLPAFHREFYAREGNSWEATRTLHSSYMEVRSRLIEVGQSASQVKKDELAELWKSAESSALAALAAAVDAYNYLEDFPEHEINAHEQVHDVGAFIAGVFGCSMSSVDGIYQLTCPIQLMHRRFGFSAGIVHVINCSICDQDLDECEHLLDVQYPVLVARDGDGRCSACREVDCPHSPGEEILVATSEVFENPTMREVTLTPRPRDPRARLDMIELDRADLGTEFNRELNGEDLECWECIAPCQGFIGIS